MSRETAYKPTMRFSEEEARRIRAIAKVAGRKPSEWMKRHILKACPAPADPCEGCEGTCESCPHDKPAPAQRNWSREALARSIKRANAPELCAPYNPLDGMRIHRELMARSRAREVYQAKAATIIAQNADCFIAQWILQNTDKCIADYTMMHRQVYEGGIMETRISIEKIGKGQL